MKAILLFTGILIFNGLVAQELYVFTEPASNMPAKSLAVKQSFKGVKNIGGGSDSRYATELMFGVNKQLMLHTAVSFSNMYTPAMRFESIKLYGKYRVISVDGLYSHFRMAAYAEASHSRNGPVYDELSLDGDQSGIQAGIIATQLLHKLALSTSIGLTESLQMARWEKSFPQTVPFSAVSYSLSAGYLVLPKTYTSYNQTNLNLYVELLGQNTTDIKRHYIDLAPAAQLIFNSQVKLNIGYRFQLDGDMKRMAEKNWLVSFEWLFLN